MVGLSGLEPPTSRLSPDEASTRIAAFASTLIGSFAAFAVDIGENAPTVTAKAANDQLL